MRVCVLPGIGATSGYAIPQKLDIKDVVAEYVSLGDPEYLWQRFLANLLLEPLSDLG